MELLRTKRLLLRNWAESDLDAFFDLYSREDVIRWLGRHPRRALATVHEACERLRRWHDRHDSRSQAVATRLGMHDEGITQRWFGLTSRQFRKVLKTP